MVVSLGLDLSDEVVVGVLLDRKAKLLGRAALPPQRRGTSGGALAGTVSIVAAAAVAATGPPVDARPVCAAVSVAPCGPRMRAHCAAALARIVVPGGPCMVIPAHIAAWWGATEGQPGLVVDAGLGSAVYGRNSSAREFRADGRGYLLGDTGSMFALGRTAIERCVARLHAGEVPDVLDAAVLDYAAATGADALMDWVYADPRTERIAGVATALAQAAQAGATPALDLLNRACDRLASAAARGARTLGASPSSLPVHLSGSLLGLAPGLDQRFARSLGVLAGRDEGEGPVSVETARHDRAWGAARYALHQVAELT